MNDKYKIDVRRFPSFNCPNPQCGAKNVLFAINKDAYNNSKIMIIEDIKPYMCVDYVIICPKCKTRLFICNQSLINTPLVQV